MSKKQKTSYLWSYFTTIDEVKKLARCDLCGGVQNFKSTVSNLKNHLSKKHPTIQLNSKDSIVISTAGPSTSNNNFLVGSIETNTNVDSGGDGDTLPHKLPAKQPVLNSQPNIRSFLPQSRKISETQKKKLDNLLLNMCIYDYQPFSIVEDKGFSSFVSALNPSYKLPNRKTISSALLPAEYEACLNAVRHTLTLVKSVALSTDTWTSANTENYLAVTPHYISDNFEDLNSPFCLNVLK